MTERADLTTCRLLTVSQVSHLLSIHERTVWRFSAASEAGLSQFPKPIRLAAKTVRWRLSDVQAYLDRLAGEDKP